MTTNDEYAKKVFRRLLLSALNAVRSVNCERSGLMKELKSAPELERNAERLELDRALGY